MGYFNFFNDKTQRLSHHGILGQKWGVRRFQNKDGSRTVAGKARYGKGVSEKDVDRIRNMVMNARYGEDITKKVVKIANGDESKLKAADEAVNEYVKETKVLREEANEMFKPLDNEKTRTYYEACSEIANFGDRNPKGVKGLTLDDIGWASYMGIFEDGQQSDKTAYSMFADEHGLAKRCSEIDKAHHEAYKEANAKVKSSVEEALGDVGKQPINKDKSDSASVASMVATQKMNAAGEPYLYDVLSGSSAEYFTDKDRADFKEAKRIASKIDGGGKDENSWYYLNKAIQNLGMSNEVASDLSDSDWKKINSEIAKLKR